MSAILLLESLFRGPAAVTAIVAFAVLVAAFALLVDAFGRALSRIILAKAAADRLSAPTIARLPAVGASDGGPPLSQGHRLRPGIRKAGRPGPGAGAPP